MNTSRFFIEQPLKFQTKVDLPPSLCHYLGGVLRKRGGQSITLFNGDGVEYLSNIRALSKRSGSVEVVSQTPNLIATTDINLFQPLIAQDKMDWVLQKTCELGVQSIQLIITQFCSAKWIASKQEKKLMHWKRVLISACEQCGRGDVPNIYFPKPIADVLDYMPRCSVFHPQKKAQKTVKEGGKNRNWVLVGPEGGLSTEEVNDLVDSGAQLTVLGGRILRTETASMVAVAYKTLLS